MDAIPPDPAGRNPGPFTKLMIWLVGIDEETLRECPAHDWDNVRAIGLLLLFVWIYQTALLSMIAFQLRAPDGGIHPELVLGAMFLATLVLLIDSYVFLRAGFHADGLKELARGGLDLTGGMMAQIKAGFFLCLRILLSLGFAQLSAIFMGLILFKPDIVAEIEHFYQQQNAPLIASVTLQTDAEIARAADAVKQTGAHVEALQKQIAAMRDGMVNPATSDAAIQAEQAEVAELLAQKGRRETELVAAQSYSANELAGIKGDPSNSGVPGRGPVRAAAEERVRSAEANVAAASQSLAEARTRLDDLRKQASLSADDRARQAGGAVAQLEQDLKTAMTELAKLRDRQDALVKDRSDTIHTGIENAPDRIGRDTGFLAQLRALRRVSNDPEIAAIILLIDFTSFGLELAAVLVKTTCVIPTTYAALLARNAYMRVVRLVDEMDQEIRQRPDEPEEEAEFLPPITVPVGDDPAADDELPDPAPAKRPRGRPKKKPVEKLPLEQSSQPAGGEQGKAP